MVERVVAVEGSRQTVEEEATNETELTERERNQASKSEIRAR
jgi:hypothetical protein